MSKKFILEIGTENLPARHCMQIEKQLNTQKIRSIAEENNIQLKNHKLLLTPRRIILLADSIKQISEVLEIKGPPKDIAFKDGEPNEIANKFAKKNKVSPNDFEYKKMHGKEFIFISKDISDQFEKNVETFTNDLLDAIHIDKPMRWDQTGMCFSRPIRWILCMQGSKVLKTRINKIVASNITRGPRFSGAKEIEISDASDYIKKLEKEGIVLDQEERKKYVQEKVKGTSANEYLIKENAYLVECPLAINCEFDKEFLELPKTIRDAVLVGHQKYFPMEENKFTVIVDHKEDREGLIKEGNEKVVESRLSDGRFFYKLDLERDFEEFVEMTNKIVFQEDLGTMKDKTDRMIKISKQISSDTDLDDKKVVESARLCKADLSTTLVNELTSLQGKAARIYLEEKGYDKDIAIAVEEHYLPEGANDKLPHTKLGVVISLADKIDTLYGLFSVNIEPKGSSDPYGQRRAAIGIVRILWENKHKLNISLQKIIDAASTVYPNTEVSEKTKKYLLTRLEQIVRKNKDYNLSTELIRSIIFNEMDDLSKKKSLLREVEDIKDDENFESLTELIKRVHNILAKIKSLPKIEVEESKLNKSELKLFEAIQDQHNYSISDLMKIVEPANNFFEDNMVMAEDMDERNHRLNLLRNAEKLINKYLKPEHLLS